MAAFIYKTRQFLNERDYWNPRFGRWQKTTDYGPWIVVSPFQSLGAALRFYKGRNKSRDDHAIFHRGKRVEHCRCKKGLPTCPHCEISNQESPKQLLFDFAVNSK